MDVQILPLKCTPISLKTGSCITLAFLFIIIAFILPSFASSAYSQASHDYFDLLRYGFVPKETISSLVFDIATRTKRLKSSYPEIPISFRLYPFFLKSLLSPLVSFVFPSVAFCFFL